MSVLMKFKSIFGILCLLVTGLIAQQAQYRFEHLSLEEGITHNLTYSIIQDSKGFMWFGTFYGLIRHDGLDYTNFKHIPFDTNSVSSDDIISLYEDRHGYIWVGTWSGGLNRFNPNTETFRQFRHDPVDSLSISNDVVYAMAEDKSGRLWIGTENGLNRFVPKNDPQNNLGRSYFVQYYKNDSKSSLNNNNIRSLFLDSSGRFWVGVNEGGLHYYDHENDSFVRLEEVTRDGSTSVINILEDDKKNLWVATWGGGLKKVQVIESDENDVIGLRLNTFRHDPQDPSSISNNFIWSLEQDKSGNLWIGTYDGLNMFDTGSKRFYRYYHDPKNANTISSDKISAIKLDRSGVLWIGTFRGGIDRIVPGLAQFEHFLYNPFDPRSLIDKEVTALLQDDEDNIWVGTVSGITRIVKNDDTYRYYRFQFEEINPKNKLDNYITALAEDRNGNIWVGTHNGLNCIKEDGTVAHYDLPILPDENEQGNIITSLLVDKKGWLWVGTITHGLNLFDNKTKIFTSFRHDPDDSTSLTTNYVVSLFEDRQGTIWVGTYSGLNKLTLLSPSAGQPQVSFQRFLPTTSGRFQTNDNVFSIYEDSRNNLWIGTNTGLIRYNKDTRALTKFDESTGLPNNVICGILEDNDKNLWVSTFKGLFKLNTHDNSVNNYYTLHGLQGNIFTPGAYYKNDDGKMMFGGINGFNAFFPENITRFEQPPPVVITSFKVFDDELKFDKRISDVEEIRLTYEQNFFTITFAALDYRLPERNQFYYYLEGFDRDWVYNETKNYASYTNLDPGEYVFHVRGSNSNGVWNNDGASVRLIISPPWWQTWWMKSLTGITSMVLLFVVIFLIQRNEKRKTEFNKKISELKLQALRAQMNPHFIFNTINSIQYFISCNDQESAFLYLSKFSKLMRQTLDNSAKSRISVQRELEALQLYMDLQKLRFENKFEYKIDIDPQIDIHNYEIPTMLIQPYIENAINHGISKKKSKGHINVILQKENSNLNCIIEDDGIGINKSLAMKKNNSDHTSSGMRLTRERLGIINAGKLDDIYISVIDRNEEDHKMNGTKVTIKIPLLSSPN